MLKIRGNDFEYKGNKIGRLFDIPESLKEEIKEFITGYETAKEQGYEQGYTDAEQEIARRVHGSGS